MSKRPFPGITEADGSSSSFSGDFHKFGIEWHPGSLNWYLDDELVYSVATPYVSEQLMHPVFDLSVGGLNAGTVDPTVFPATMEIDYIRVWQLR